MIVNGICINKINGCVGVIFISVWIGVLSLVVVIWLGRFMYK